MLIINVTYKLIPGMRDAYIEALKKNRIAERCSAEAGNLAYRFFVPIDEADTDTVFLLEQYKDDDAVAEHMKQDHYAELQEIKAQYVESTDIKKYRD